MEEAQAVPALRHTRLEDVLAIAVGSFLVSLGLSLLAWSGLVTGGTAGLSLLLAQVLPLPFWALFVLVNLPFFALAVRRKGWDFALRTALAIGAVAALSPVHPLLLQLGEVPPAYAAIAGNLLAGVGLLILFRHNASLGGFNIVALVAQDRLGWRAGYVLLALDGVVVLASLLVFPPLITLLSAVGAVTLSLILAFNHRPGRYAAVPSSFLGGRWSQGH
ncbi:MAG TPA: YitT family protein [Naasia sp.]|jgi:uncharacterized membrane-anchored protein YitT (DUF2179 family)